ncbi:MAG: hypothetical protein A2Z88_05325 [Omnitrophica WOR_2 bacterium GWA2_47_8]|nr:MAG: hypothetical protein A2Z88_05325 [Omnitrophica WOR_2 bacterium GWA2_47_8]
MYARMFLLALGWATHDPYEREAARAVRSYLIWLLIPIAMLLFVFMGLGFLLTRDIRFALVVTIFVACALPILFLGTPKERISREIVKSLELHDMQSWVVRCLSKKHSIKKMIPVFIADLKVLQARYVSCAPTPVILIDKILARRCEYRSLSGIVCHEVGHHVLPLGLDFFSIVTVFQIASVDNLVDHARMKLLERSQLIERYEQVCGWSKGRGEMILPPQLWGLVYRVFWVFSSYPGHHRREYACDAISALLLRDVVPLIVGLGIAIKGEAESLSDLSTHPSLQKRITALLAINAAVANTH